MGMWHTESAIAPSLSPWLRADPWVVVADAMRWCVLRLREGLCVTARPISRSDIKSTQIVSSLPERCRIVFVSSWVSITKRSLQEKTRKPVRNSRRFCKKNAPRAPLASDLILNQGCLFLAGIMC
jgi:hypothetical protein